MGKVTIMAIKLANGELADRPLLTEEDLKFIMLCVHNTTVNSEKLALQKDAVLNKLLASKLRIDKLKLT